jgi:hypothetical protein
MTELDTPIQLQEALITRLQDWRNDSALVPNPLWTPAISTLIQAQDTIGWKNFLEGLPSRLWSLHMSHHYTSIGSTLCPDRWLLKVQLALHHLVWSQWEHRYQILHNDVKPQNRRAITLLNQAISREYQIGTDDLPPSDHYHFHPPPLLNALNHSTSHKRCSRVEVYVCVTYGGSTHAPCERPVFRPRFISSNACDTKPLLKVRQIAYDTY